MGNKHIRPYANVTEFPGSHNKNVNRVGIFSSNYLMKKKICVYVYISVLPSRLSFIPNKDYNIVLSLFLQFY